MRKWIKLAESLERPSEIVHAQLARWIAETGMTPKEINAGLCFDFAEELPEDMFQPMGLGNFMNHDYENNKSCFDATGYDLELINQHWPQMLLPNGITWEEFFKVTHDGCHGWAYCNVDGLCYDAEAPDGVASPFELPWFERFFDWYRREHQSQLTEGRGAFTSEQAKEIGSCAVIAMSHITGLSWDEVFEHAKKYFGRYGMNAGDISWTMKELGWKMESYYEMPWLTAKGPWSLDQKPPSMTVRQAEKWLQENNPGAKLICQIHVKGVPHSVAFTDGKFHNVLGAYKAKIRLCSICTKVGDHLTESEGPLHDWYRLSEDELRQFAAQYVGFATNEMSDPADLSWSIEDLDTDVFNSVAMDWHHYFKDEVEGRYDFVDEDFHSPIVVSYEMGEWIIWDGYHRIATALYRGDFTIMAVVGREQ